MGKKPKPEKVKKAKNWSGKVRKIKKHLRKFPTDRLADEALKKYGY